MSKLLTFPGWHCQRQSLWYGDLFTIRWGFSSQTLNIFLPLVLCIWFTLHKEISLNRFFSCFLSYFSSLSLKVRGFLVRACVRGPSVSGEVKYFLLIFWVHPMKWEKFCRSFFTVLSWPILDNPKSKTLATHFSPDRILLVFIFLCYYVSHLLCMLFLNLLLFLHVFVFVAA